MRTLILHFDGACEPNNPGGIATCGWTIREGEDLLASGSKEVRRGEGATNNFAEYAALGLALRWLVDNPQGEITLDVRGDSNLVIKQIQGAWKCNHEHLRKLRDRCKELIAAIAPETCSLRWVPREMNEEADALSRQAYEAATGKRFPERSKT